MQVRPLRYAYRTPNGARPVTEVHQQDAQVLATLLAHPRVTRDTLKHALRAYADIRLPLASEFYSAARQAGTLLTNANLSLEDCVSQVRAVSNAVWEKGSPEENARKGVELFEAAISANF